MPQSDCQFSYLQEGDTKGNPIANRYAKFACLVVVPGRAFLRGLLDLNVGVHSPHHYVRINKEIKADIKLWQSFLTGFNGRSFFLEDF